MNIKTIARKVTLKDHFLERAEKKLEKLDKFFTSEAEAQVTVTLEKDRQTVEITVRDTGFVVRSEKTDKMMENAFDSAFDNIQRQIVKNRKKFGEKAHSFDFTDFADYQEEADEFDVIREKHFFLKPQSVEDAIMEMNLVGHSFFVFKNVDTNKIEVVYSRKDGSYGLLIPE